jgi:hypothetical protein
LAATQKKLLTIERNEKINYRGKSKEDHDRSLTQVEDLLVKSRLQSEANYNKFIEEEKKRRNSDERCKITRDHLERQRAVTTELQHSLHDAQQTLSDTQAKNQRLRKDNRDALADAAALREVTYYQIIRIFSIFDSKL